MTKQFSEGLFYLQLNILPWAFAYGNIFFCIGDLSRMVQ